MSETSPFFSGDTPQFFFRTTDATGRAELTGDARGVMPRRFNWMSESAE